MTKTNRIQQFFFYSLLLLMTILSFSLEVQGIDHYQVIVMGTEPEGIVAAVSAARSGSRTLLIQSQEGFGGTMIAARLNSIDMNYSHQGTILTKGIFLEFYEAMGGDSFDVQEGEYFFRQLIEGEENLTFMEAHSWDVFTPEDEMLLFLSIYDGKEVHVVLGDRFIDATGDAKLAAMAGVPYRVGKEDLGYEASMSVTLVFEITGVDWRTIMTYLRTDGNPHSGANERSAWGFAPIISNYEATDPQMMLRGLNMGRQKDGTVLINGLLIYDVDPLSPSSREDGIERAKREVEKIVPFLVEHVPGFEEAYLSDYASKLYIRESRYIEGLYRLDINDLLGHRMFWDRIALASYPIDLHPTYVGHWGVILGRPSVYSIPLRCLIPVNVKNLLVIGRSASFSSLAAGSARVIPVGMAMGEAAGIASTYTIEEGLDFHSLIESKEDVENIQSLIVAAGGYLREYNVPDPHEGHWAFPYIQSIRRSGHLAGGYNNQLYLDDSITYPSFINLMNVSLYTLTREVKPLNVHPFSFPQTEEYMTGEMAASYLAKAYALFHPPLIDNSLDGLLVAGIISSDIRERILDDGVLTRAEAIALLAQLIEAIHKG